MEDVQNGEARPLIKNTKEFQSYPWPCMVQGGNSGVVFRKNGTHYSTAFVESFPQDPIPTFLRGEGSTIKEAEDKCWQQYQVYMKCPHPNFERRHYTNGAGYCTECGTWFSRLFEPLPDDPNRKKSLLEKAFLGDTPALNEIINTFVKVKVETELETEDGIDCNL